MSFLKASLWAVTQLAVVVLAMADVMVQLNVNRPFNDVSDKFVSFSMKPEDLYNALDGPHRKSMSRMAVMLGDSYLKFLNDYAFAVNGPAKLRNPTRVIWKGFNRWSRAVNWTMIVPLPYTPTTWDPVQALKILNTSYMTGISECIWQLGTDFSSISAKDYVEELNTLNLLVESFKPYVDDWQIMGADISPGSSADETRRYIEMTKDMNAAYGWTQPLEVSAPDEIGSYIYDNEPALKALIKNKVPVWLNLAQPSSLAKQKRVGNVLQNDEVSNGLRWAKTLGDAASSGFDVVFKRITLYDLEKPDLSFFVTALFKKIMGARVFPSRPLDAYAGANKLYTHCANAVSGGIAFMVVNADKEPLQISVRSLIKMTGPEIWQYTLTSSKGDVYLNNKKLYLNSTLAPQMKLRKREVSLHLNTPEQSVSFWVMPTANLEHCQYTEVEASEVEREASVEKVTENPGELSSSDKLLRKLIKEAALPNSPIARVFSRGRRYAVPNERPKRFVLEDKKEKMLSGLGKIFQPLTPFEDKPLQKRESTHRTPPAFQWFKDLMDKSFKGEMPLLKRGSRSVDNRYFGPFFMNREGKKTTITKKIFEIRKPERKTKPLFDFNDFNEEEFFKRLSEQAEPEPVVLPRGDVHMKHITNTEGEEIEDEEEVQRSVRRSQSLEEASKEGGLAEAKPLRLLPTEFYEALPTTISANQQKKHDLKASLAKTFNSLLFPDILGKSANKAAYKKNLFKVKEEAVEDAVDNGKELSTTKYHKGSQSADDFIQAQIELGKAFLEDIEEGNKSESEEIPQAKSSTTSTTTTSTTATTTTEVSPEAEKSLESPNKYNVLDFWHLNGDIFKEPEDEAATDLAKPNNDEFEVEEVPWFDLSTLHKPAPSPNKFAPLSRVTRELKYDPYDDEYWRTNVIDKNDELTPLGAMHAPAQLSYYEYEVKGEKANDKSNNKMDDIEVLLTDEEYYRHLFSKVRDRVSKLLDVFSRHVGHWYNVLTKHLESTNGEVYTVPAEPTSTSNSNNTIKLQ